METMQKYTKQDIINMVEDEDVEFIRMQFTDIEGNFKNVAITASQLEKALNNDCMFDCSLVEGMSAYRQCRYVFVSGPEYIYDFSMASTAGQGSQVYL